MLLAHMDHAQHNFTSGEQILQSIKDRELKRVNSIFKNYPVRSVGPVVQGGRISDIAVSPNNTKEFYIAFASGGVFKTQNNGITFEPVFDHQSALTIGDICVAPSNPEIIWVGTGENNSSRSSYAGSGVYKSLDAGVNWQFVGLESTQHTGRIIIHPDDPDIVWVATMGNLYTHNPERGVYKTNDGGKTWTKTLFLNDSTGAIDLGIHPDNPDVLWATMWERTRKAWNFKGHGPGSGIYKSTDGGNSWTKVMSGIENPEYSGRIGIDVCLTNPNVLYALVDSQYETKSQKEREDEELIAADFVDMDVGTFLALDDDKLNDFLKDNFFPVKYTAEKVKKDIQEEKYKPQALTEYLGDANSALFDTKVTGAEVYKSINYGESWEKTHDFWLEGVYHTYGYYFGEIRVSPKDPDLIYVFGVPLLKSVDSGKSYVRIDTLGDVHADHHAMWINPEDPDHIILGNDGGLYMTYDEGKAWNHINNIPAGQFYTVNVDMEKPYNIYGGLQDNGVLFGSSTSIPNETRHWEYLFGGDGMFVIPDPRNNNLVYLGYQFGNYYRINTETGDRKYIASRHDIGEEPLRYNWRTPMLMSKHNSDILYIGAQKVFRTMNKAETWEAISEDLTSNLPNGNVPYSTITCIEESPLKFGLLYVGTDDGNVQVSKDGGFSWSLKNAGLPSKKWVTSIYPSAFDEPTVYLSLTGYREDDFTTYVYKSENFGDTWERINGQIEDEAVNVVLEDPVNQGLLYLGTDHGTYVSFNDGSYWHLMAQIPNVANYDMVVHPRDHDLVIGTHGRSIYVLSLEPIREMMGKDLSTTFALFKPDKVRHSKRWGKKRYPYLKAYKPESRIMYYAPQKEHFINFEVYQDEIMLFEDTFQVPHNGYNFYSWDLMVNILDKKNKRITSEFEYVKKGKYECKFTLDGQIKSVEVLVE